MGPNASTGVQEDHVELVDSTGTIPTLHILPVHAPSEYQLFPSLAHHLEGRHFVDENELQSSSDHKSSDFYKKGIDKLPER
ncbi:hypothetical protein RB195_000586 [Necator americanus]|uniref:Uncharacterized protein n=1 Tax=Necator americanus TaxID=51031 RepID=A0ABR1DB54_NECAM